MVQKMIRADSLSFEYKDYSTLKMHELNREIGSVFQNPRSQFFTENTTSELVFPMENYGYSKEEMQQNLCESKSTLSKKTNRLLTLILRGHLSSKLKQVQHSNQTEHS